MLLTDFLHPSGLGQTKNQEQGLTGKNLVMLHDQGGTFLILIFAINKK